MFSLRAPIAITLCNVSVVHIHSNGDFPFLFDASTKTNNWKKANRQRPNCKMNNINRLFWMAFYLCDLFFCRCRSDCHFVFFVCLNNFQLHLCAFWCNFESLNGNTVCTIFPLFSYQWSINVYSLTVFINSNWHHSQLWMNRNFHDIALVLGDVCCVHDILLFCIRSRVRKVG